MYFALFTFTPPSTMDPPYTYLFRILLLLSIVTNSYQASMTNQSRFFTLMKKSLSGNSLTAWDVSGGKSYCNYTGIGCNDEGNVLQVDISSWLLSGSLPEDICTYLPQLRILRLGDNNFRGPFPHSIVNCSLLEELDMSSNSLNGRLPDFSPMISLKILDLSFNSFTGEFPTSVMNLPNLKELNFIENEGFRLWRFPGNISSMTKIRSLILSSCMLSGEIPKSIGNLTSIVDLEFSGNYLVGRIPREIGLLKNLQMLELYFNEVAGGIPEELGNLTGLTDLDMSVNKLTGKLPAAICRLPKLIVLHLYNNSLTGEIPREIEKSTTLISLSLYANLFTGQVPRHLGRFSPMVVLDLSENQLTGELPDEVCHGGKLLYFLVLENMFSGSIPEKYAKCTSLLRFRVSSNRLEGTIPEGLLDLPHVTIIDLGSNNLSGPIARTIGNARNLSELFLQNNKISGVLPPEISQALNLVKLDLSDNLLSGPLPSEIDNLKKLNLLMLQGNKFTSSIPESLSSLKSINVLDLSRNLLIGSVPESLGELLPNSINFTNNLLSGPIPQAIIKGGQLESFLGNPGLCIPDDLNPADPNFPICSQKSIRKKVNHIWVVGISIGVFIVGGVLFLKRWLGKEMDVLEDEETYSSSSLSFTAKNFHGRSFDQRKITEGMTDKNVLKHGGSGTVYKIDLSNGEAVAVKRLWARKSEDSASDGNLTAGKDLKTVAETLGSITHKNIVKLYCHLSSLRYDLLVYEYIPNGNLCDALHIAQNLLDWPTRHQIALGIAQGLAYLHHDLLPPIIHRDIKSANILLDSNFQPKVADFGIARVVRERGKASTTIIAGTYGYMAPEYAYCSKATTKCDVYSFGVVLMELVTGKKPLEEEFGENENIVHWVTKKVETREGAMEVVDKRLSDSARDEMIKILRISIRCTCGTPALRPAMIEVVQLLTEADPDLILASHHKRQNKKHSSWDEESINELRFPE